MYGGLFQAAPCFSRSSLYMPTHKCSQCLNTGISRAESDLGSLHFFIWEISVPLTEWNCLRIKLWIHEKHIWELRGEELYESISSQLYLRNFCSWEKKAFCSCVYNWDDLLSYKCLCIVCTNLERLWYFLSSSSESSLTIRCLKSRVPFLW